MVGDLQNQAWICKDTYAFKVQWEPWKFAQLPRQYWKDVKNQRKYLDWLARQLSLHNPVDWYKVQLVDIKQRGGDEILKVYNGSIQKMLQTVYQEHSWSSTISLDYWKDMRNQRAFFDQLSKMLKLSSMEDWYKVNPDEVTHRGAAQLLHHHYRGSLIEALRAIYPEVDFKIWKFAYIPRSFWLDIKNLRLYFDQVAPELSVSSLQEWYKVNIQDLYTRGAREVLTYTYKNSLAKALSAAYPEHTFHIWKFDRVPQGYWEDVDNQREFFDHIEKELGIVDKDEWYDVRFDDLNSKAKGVLTNHYQGSLLNALKVIYPDHKWKQREAPAVPGPKNDLEVKQLLDSLWKQLKIKDWKDWYTVPAKELQILNVLTIYEILRARDGLQTLLPKHYPQYPWESHKFINSAKSKASQTWLKKMVEDIFPNENILEDHFHPKLIFSDSGRPMQLDVYVPSKSIAFEYQGIQHYEDVYYFGSSLRMYEERDQEKKKACQEANITLIEVPYWWDFKKESLQATIAQARPDLIKTFVKTEPIPNEPPKKERRTKEEEAVARGIMLAKDWMRDMDPTGWWLSEKYDGIRAYWNGQKMFTKQGRIITVPSFWTEKLPPVALDGELWMGKNKFQEIMQISSANSNDLWKRVQFVLFDAPENKGLYEERVESLHQMQAKCPSHVFVAPTTKCSDQNHLNEYMKKVLQEGGEGVILRKPRSPYEPGRSTSLYKFKNYQDTEVRFISIHNHWMGGTVWLCEQPNGHKCLVRCSGDVYQNPPKQGTILTVSHEGFWLSGKLKSPQFIRERHDVAWESVVRDFKATKT